MDGGTSTAEEQQTTAQVYDVHVRVPREMQETLKKSAQLAYKLGLTTKPDLTDLLNLLIGWGDAVPT